jgi:large subunit ribosomal protein L1
LGKKIRVLVFAEGEAANTARQAGADYVGADDLMKQIEDGWVDFDVAIATPDLMGKVGRLGRVLGRRGLMPNPRTGTVVQSQDFNRAIQEAKQGRVEFRLDRAAIIHVAIGKASFDTEKLLENMSSLFNTVMRARPSAVKGQFIKTAYLTTTMGPSIKLDVSGMSAMSN